MLKLLASVFSIYELIFSPLPNLRILKIKRSGFYVNWIFQLRECHPTKLWQSFCPFSLSFDRTNDKVGETKKRKFFCLLQLLSCFFHYNVPVTLKKRLKIKVAGNSFQVLSRSCAVTYNHSLLSDVIKVPIHLCPRQW